MECGRFSISSGGTFHNSLASVLVYWRERAIHALAQWLLGKNSGWATFRFHQTQYNWDTVTWDSICACSLSWVLRDYFTTDLRFLLSLAFCFYVKNSSKTKQIKDSFQVTCLHVYLTRLWKTASVQWTCLIGQFLVWWEVIERFLLVLNKRSTWSSSIWLEKLGRQWSFGFI